MYSDTVPAFLTEGRHFRLWAASKRKAARILTDAGRKLWLCSALAVYFTFATMALKASALFMARSASTLRLISIPAL